MECTGVWYSNWLKNPPVSSIALCQRSGVFSERFRYSDSHNLIFRAALSKVNLWPFVLWLSFVNLWQIFFHLCLPRHWLQLFWLPQPLLQHRSGVTIKLAVGLSGFWKTNRLNDDEFVSDSSSIFSRIDVVALLLKKFNLFACYRWNGTESALIFNWAII